mmetsp:Transcript_9400/g.18826  ORF Transcript_9400/g.18826 Transcript_9400/m.18826 type:complete len:259 (-) Transcript_9400:423-1199(-)
MFRCLAITEFHTEMCSGIRNPVSQITLSRAQLATALWSVNTSIPRRYEAYLLAKSVVHCFASLTSLQIVHSVNHGRIVKRGHSHSQPASIMRIKTQAPDPSRGTGKRILCDGDSLTAGLLGNWCAKFEPYAKRLGQLLNTRVDHVGLSGWDTQQMVDALDSPSSEDVKRVRWEPAGLRLALQRAKDDNDPYDVVIIMAGTNNLTTLLPFPALLSVHRLTVSAGCRRQTMLRISSSFTPALQTLARRSFRLRSRGTASS